MIIIMWPFWFVAVLDVIHKGSWHDVVTDDGRCIEASLAPPCPLHTATTSTVDEFC